MAVKKFLLPGDRAGTLFNLDLEEFTVDGSAVIREKVIIAGPETGTVSRVDASTTAVTLLAANTLRKAAIFYSDSSATLYLKLGSGATLTSFTIKLLPDSTFAIPLPVYTGIVTGIWDTATGAVAVTEME